MSHNFSSENRAVSDVIWKNVMQQAIQVTDGNIIPRMRVA
jgi:hypothetical protein